MDHRHEAASEAADPSIDPVIARLRGIEKTFDGESLVVKGVDLDIGPWLI